MSDGMTGLASLRQSYMIIRGAAVLGFPVFGVPVRSISNT